MPSSAACECGKERWSVKTGTDQDAGQVNLTTINPTTIQAMRAWNAPDNLPGDARAAAQEKQVWVVDATLVKFKTEKDCDYHLVLSDEAGRTLVVEVVAPHCVGAGSPFASKISTVRSKFESSVSTSGSSWKVVNRPVRVTGVGFFDRLHGQTGMAANGIELHPVVDIVFEPASAGGTAAGGGTTTGPGSELIVNGDFEATSTSGSSGPGWSTTSTVQNANYLSTAGTYPHSGDKYAYLGAKNSSVGTLTQAVTIPASASTAVLTCWVNVVTSEELDAEAYDYLRVEVQNSNGTVLATPLIMQNGDAVAANNTPGRYIAARAVDLSAFKGQTVRIVFRASCDQSFPTTFRVDDVSLKIGN